MQHFYIRRAGIMALKCGFVAAGLFAIWLLGGMAENPALWWLYALASVGSMSAGLLLLGLSVEAETELDRIEARRKSVPVSKIERRNRA